jgi:hypothetical protein
MVSTHPANRLKFRAMFASGARARAVLLLALAALPASTARCSNVAGAPGTLGGAGTCVATSAGGEAGAGDEGGSSSCAPSDSDGMNGGCYAFDLTVDDTGFSPFILKSENLAQVTITLRNAGTKPHDLVVGCIPVSFPGCPPQQCFPSAANIAMLAPGQSATTTFVTPNLEGIYTFRSDLPGDSQLDSDGGVSGLWGQFVVQ